MTLREQFKKEIDTNWLNSQGEPDIDYVEWLESRLSRPTLTDEDINDEIKKWEKTLDTPIGIKTAFEMGIRLGRDFIPEIRIEWQNNIAYCNDEEIGSIESTEDDYCGFNLFNMPFYNEDGRYKTFTKEEAKQAVEDSFREFIQKILER